MKYALVCLALAIVLTQPMPTPAADAQRQAAVAERAEEVMPFSLKATTHIFTKTAKGGVQRVVAGNATDAKQVILVRAHLQKIKEQFLKGDFSGPAHVHGEDMPGLDALRSARPGKIRIEYTEVVGGAELSYRTSDPVLVTALHQWFDAQLSDHGPDAMEGQQHRHGSMPGN